MNKYVMYLMFTLLTAISFPATATAALYPLPNEAQKTRFQYLLKELRCLVCQNQDLADSNASLAQDLRKQVYDMLTTGRTDAEIRSYLTARYGDFILFSPPLNAKVLFLWFGPALFLLFGLVVFWRLCCKAKRA